MIWLCAITTSAQEMTLLPPPPGDRPTWHWPAHSGRSWRCSYSGKMVVPSAAVKRPTDAWLASWAKTSGGMCCVICCTINVPYEKIQSHEPIRLSDGTPVTPHRSSQMYKDTQLLWLPQITKTDGINKLINNVSCKSYRMARREISGGRLSGAKNSVNNIAEFE